MTTVYHAYEIWSRGKLLATQLFRADRTPAQLKRYLVSVEGLPCNITLQRVRIKKAHKA